MKSTDLEALRVRAANDPAGTITVDSQALLALLSHIDELRTDLHSIDTFIGRSEREDLGGRGSAWAWNDLLDQFSRVRRLYHYSIDVIQAPVIERMDVAEKQVGAVRALAQNAINYYNHHTMIKAKKVLDLLGPDTSRD